MKDLLDKLSSYNVFNYLLPGIIFVVLSKAFTSYSFEQKDVILGAFLYYFIGLVISRVGSLLVEPVLRKIHFVQFAEYSEFVSASHKDEKLNILSETNNMYRTFCALFLMILILKLYEKVTMAFPDASHWSRHVVIVGLLIIFLWAYRKQTQYVRQRVESKGGEKHG